MFLQEGTSMLDKAKKTQKLLQSAPFLWTFFLILLAYQVIGCFPFVPVEGDGIGIANGATQMLERGLGNCPLAYRYSVQPGTYAIIILFHKIFGLDTFTSFSILSGLASLTFIVIAASFLKRILCCPFPVAGIMLLLFQEAFAEGYYPNSTVLASVFAVLALYQLTLGHRPMILIGAGLCFAMAGWIRFDAIFIAPASLVILSTKELKAGIYRTILLSIITGILLLTLLYLSDSGLGLILKSASKHSTSIRPGLVLGLGNLNVRSFLSLFSGVVIFLAFTGLIKMVLHKQWRLLALIAVSIAPVLLAYWGKFNSPKYLYYVLPFFSLPVTLGVIWAWSWPWNKWQVKIWWGAVGILFCIQYIFGLRVSFPTKPYVKEPYPTFYEIISKAIPASSIDHASLVIGAGSVISTEDGYRLSSGIIWSPLLWYNYKTIVNNELELFKPYFRRFLDSPSRILTVTYGAHQLISKMLLENGYNPVGRKIVRDSKFWWTEIRWRKGEHYLTTANNEIKVKTYDALKVAVDLLGVENVLCVVTSGWLMDIIEKNMRYKERVCGFFDIGTFAAYKIDVTKL